MAAPRRIAGVCAAGGVDVGDGGPPSADDVTALPAEGPADAAADGAAEGAAEGAGDGPPAIAAEGSAGGPSPASTTGCACVSTA